ncbi:hypothetical protein B0T10DRAFT_485383 [Thelonectria olida]|uniref:Uncharacterized protein n=1 Tax=Thelonectria olida TaxID=1576542 RepID=A0A9P8WAD9_9HYPO|nr:hypothetical protein B0T10DRAFT_485383 [Thelonectria olida]
MLLSLALLALSTVAAAQQPTIKLYMEDAGRKGPVYVSLIDVQSGSTTVSINCPYNTVEGPCWMNKKTITYAPSTMIYTHTYDGHKSDSIDYVWASTINCALNQKNERATCIFRVTSTETGTSETSTFSHTWENYTTDEFWATVTANAKELTAGDGTTTAATASTTSASTPMSAAASALSEAASTSASETSQARVTSASASEPNATATTTTSSSTGAGASVTQNAVLVGAMAAVGGAALLV